MAVPTITSATPTSGTYEGGTSVALVGTGFTGTTGVKFGTVAAASFTVVDDTHLTAVAPAHAEGQVDIIVTNATGPSVAAAGDHFTFAPTYAQPQGNADGTDYFMDVAITPANLKSGELVKRFDPVVYPQLGGHGQPKVGAS